MEVRGKATRRGHEVNDLIRQQVGLDRGDTVAFHALHPIELSNEVDKRFTGRTPKIPNIHTGEHDLFASLLHYLLGLPQQFGYRTVTAAPPGKRDGAIDKSSRTHLHEEVAGSVVSEIEYANVRIWFAFETTDSVFSFYVVA